MIVEKWDNKDTGHESVARDDKNIASRRSSHEAESLLSTSLKSMQTMVQNMERHGISRDEVLNRVMEHFNLSKQTAAADDEELFSSTEDLDEIDKTIEDVDSVLISMKEAFQSAQRKMDTLIEDVKVRIQTSSANSPSNKQLQSLSDQDTVFSFSR